MNQIRYPNITGKTPEERQRQTENYLRYLVDQLKFALKNRTESSGGLSLSDIHAISGKDGKNGISPHVGDNGNWFIGDNDTGIPATGPAGGQGLPGPPGKDGIDGKDGYTPVKGVDYFDGLPGADGKPGEDGYTPIKGVDYFDGLPGKDGADGQPGKDGYTPVKGVDYFDGQPGADGKPGEPGKDGYTPVKGVDYFDGTPGRDGIDGKDGNDGYTPVKGVDYFDGLPGKDGKDGSPGADGQPGKDGISPLISVSDITGGHRITVTDANGTKTLDVMDGADGSPGAAGSDGYTPQKGVDYFTAADKGQIVSEVIAGLPTGTVTNAVTLSTNQTVTGVKTFTASNFFDGEQKLTFGQYCPTVTDIASGIGASMKNARAVDCQLYVAEVYAPYWASTATHGGKEPTSGLTAKVGVIDFYVITGTSGGQPTGRKLIMQMKEDGLYVLGKKVKTE